MTTADKFVPLAGGSIGGLGSGPRQTFSDFMTTNLAKYVAQENPELGPKLVNEAQQIYMRTFADWARENRIEVERSIKAYYSHQVENYSFVLQFFNYERTNQKNLLMNKIEFKREMPEISVRKTEARVISSTMRSISGHTTYRNIGFLADYYALKTDIGMREWDMKARAISDGLSAATLYSALSTFMDTPQAARTPDQLYPNRPVPQTVVDAFRNERSKWGCFNKNTGAFWEVIRDANTVFAPFGEQYYTTHLLMSRSDVFYAFKCNDFIIRVDKSGPGAVKRREAVNLPSSVGNIEIVNIPFVEFDLHNNYEASLFMHPVSNGSKAHFSDLTVRADASKYRSFQRDIEYASWASNTYDRYRFIDFLHASPAFIPVAVDDRASFDTVDNHFARPGIPDVEFLARLASVGAKPDGTNIFSTTGCRREGNERELHPLLRAVAPDKTTRYAWQPALFVGNFDESSAPSENLPFVYDTMARRLYRGLTDEQRARWSEFMAEIMSSPVNILPGDINEVASVAIGSDLAKIMDKYAADRVLDAAFSTILMNMNDCTHEHPLLSGVVYATSPAPYASLGLELNKSAAISAVVDSGLQSLGMLSKVVQSIHYYKLRYSALYTNEMLDSAGVNLVEGRATGHAEFETHRVETAAISAHVKNNPTMSIPTWLYFMHLYPLTTPDHGRNEVSTFVRRFFGTYELSAERFFAAQVVLWQLATLQTFDACYANDVAIPLGGNNLRPDEAQFMHSILALAMAPGKIGTYYHSGFDSIISFQAGVKEFKVEMEESHGFLIPNNDQMQFIPFCRGGAVIGGSDGRYIDQRQLLRSMPNFGEFQRQLRYEASNMAVLGSWRAAIEDAEEKHIDMRGFWLQNDFAWRLHDSVDFTRERDRPMFSGQFELNFVHKFASRVVPEDILELDRISFREIARRRGINFHCHALNVRRYNPVLENFEETDSVHPWEHHGPGIRDKVSSSVMVSEKSQEKSSAEKLRKKMRMTS